MDHDHGEPGVVAELFVNYEVCFSGLLVCEGVDLSCTLCKQIAEPELVGFAIHLLGIGDDFYWCISHNVF